MSKPADDIVTPQLDNQSVDDYTSCVMRDIDNLSEQHAQLVAQLQDLVSQVIEPLSAAAESMPAVCNRLEETFRRIDEFNAYLNRTHEALQALHGTLQSILDAGSVTASMKERASSFLSRFTRDPSSTSSPEQSPVWRRVPETLVIGGCAADDYMKDFARTLTSAGTAHAQLRTP